MKRLFALSLVAALLIIGIVPSAGAQTTDDLAAMFPESTVIYASVRTDDGVIETLDGLFARVVSQVPGVPPISLRLLLDQGALGVSGGTGDFDTAIRSWLGDEVAFGVLSLDNLDDDPPVVAVVQITDQKTAANFVRGLPDFDLAESGEIVIAAQRGDVHCDDGRSLVGDDPPAVVIRENLDSYLGPAP